VTNGTAPRLIWPAFVAPVIVASALILLALSTALIYVGPVDRATFGWLVPIPMLLLAPGAAGIAARWSGERTAVVAIAVVAVALGLVLTGTLVATVDRLGCEPVDDKLRILGYVAPSGLVFGAGFAAAALLALRLRRQPIVAVVVAIATTLGAWLLTVLVGGLIFQGVSCAYVP
jgi:hypothetical protein